jgi:prepilin-type N-terminal cleavage/methylation domain-containing protein
MQKNNGKGSLLFLAKVTQRETLLVKFYFCKKNCMHTKKAFSLVELIVVIIILAIL